MDKVIELFKTQQTVVVDIETNGLTPYHGSKIVGLVFYFPDVDESYYLPFRHGIGMIEDYSGYEKLGNRTNEKKQMYARMIYDKANISYSNNLSLSELDRIKEVWMLPENHIFHNAKFDLHFLLQEGFELPRNIQDTMVALHLVFEDWKSIKVKAPYTDKKTGQWVRDSEDKLEIKEQFANRQLKWFTAFLQHKSFIPSDPPAVGGEESLVKAMVDMEQFLSDRFMVDVPSINYKANMWMLNPDKVEYYARNDAILTWYLLEWCKDQFNKWDNMALWEKSCKILKEVSFRMEYNGVPLNIDKAVRESKLSDKRLEECQEIFSTKIALHSIASPKKLRVTLSSGILGSNSYNKLLPNWMENVEGLTVYPNVAVSDTSKQTLERYKDHAIIRLIQEYRKLKKSKDYLTKWIKAVDDYGIVRNNMSMDGTVSGRFSSWGDSGNWQNIPDRNGYTIKRAIEPKDDEFIVAIDYGQLEARLACYIAENILVEQGVHNNYPMMTNLFLGDYDIDKIRKVNINVEESDFITSDGSVDIHNFTKAVLNVRELLFKGLDDRQILLNRGYRLGEINDFGVVVDDLCRFYAKTLNFGLLYSGTKFMVARELKIPVSQANELFNKWHNLFPSFAIARNHFTQLALTYRERPDGENYSLYVTQPISGRHRKLKPYKQFERIIKGKNSYNYEARADKSKKVWNHIVQGLGGFLIPSALVSFGEKYGWNGVLPFALIHDAIELRVKKNSLYKVQQIIREMVAFDVRPNLVVSIEYGRNWQDMVEVEDIEAWVRKESKQYDRREKDS